MNGFLNRIIRAAALDMALYEEVGTDPKYMKDAGMVVVLSSLAAGIGTFQQAGLTGLVLGTVTAFLGWFIWAYLTCIIGTRLLPGAETTTDYGRLLRVMGFSSSPGLIRSGGIIPGIGPIVHFAGGVWMLAAMVAAVRRALKYTSTIRALAVCIIGWILQMALLWMFIALVK